MATIPIGMIVALDWISQQIRILDGITDAYGIRHPSSDGHMAQNEPWVHLITKDQQWVITCA
jgi:hypothetical protein